MIGIVEAERVADGRALAAGITERPGAAQLSLLHERRAYLHLLLRREVDEREFLF